MESKIFLFPLNNSLLLRKVTLPYHIFEPRYRQMVHDAIKTQTPVGVVPVDVNNNYQGEVCVAGVPQVLNTYPDGRMDIYITGSVKCRLTSFDQENPYKVYYYRPLLEVSDLGDRWIMELESLKQFLIKWSTKFLPDPLQQETFAKALQDNETLISYSVLFLIEDLSLKKKVVEASEMSRKVELLMKALGPKEISLGPFLPKLVL